MISDLQQLYTILEELGEVKWTYYMIFTIPPNKLLRLSEEVEL